MAWCSQGVAPGPRLVLLVAAGLALVLACLVDGVQAATVVTPITGEWRVLHAGVRPETLDTSGLLWTQIG